VIKRETRSTTLDHSSADDQEHDSLTVSARTSTIGASAELEILRSIKRVLALTDTDEKRAGPLAESSIADLLAGLTCGFA
jgi:hypothetical protein